MGQELMQLGKNIKNLRKKYNETQEELATVLGIAPNTLSTYENGRSWPDIEMIKRIAYHYRISVEQLTTYQFADVNLNEFLPNKEKIMSTIEATFPIFSSAQALNDINFKKGYDYSLRFLEMWKQGDDPLNSMVETCVNSYMESWEKSKTIESVANLLALLSMIFSSMVDIKQINMGGAILNGNTRVDKLIKNFYLRNPNTPDEVKNTHEVLNSKRTLACENEECIMECIQALKANQKWSDLGDYYFALRYLIGMVDSEYGEEINNVIGKELMWSFLQLKNIYATKFYSMQLDFTNK